MSAGGSSVPVQASGEVERVDVSLSSSEGQIPPTVAKRIEASISAIGDRVLVGKQAQLFQLNAADYNKVLADIVNRVVVGFVVSDMQIDYGTDTRIRVVLQPVGDTIQTVETTIDYGNLSEEAVRLLQTYLSGIGPAMSDLLIGLPVDSVGWAESVSQSAGRSLLEQSLPEFQANIEVVPGTDTKVHIYLIPTGDIVRSGTVEFRKTTIPRMLLYHAVSRTEDAMHGLEGLPLRFVQRHSLQIAQDMKGILMDDSFIRRYDIAVETELQSGEETKLKVDALTDRWLIQTQAWVDTGREGNRNMTAEAMLGRYVGKRELLFGEMRFYPGPVEWNIYAGWAHRFGASTVIGYKYDFSKDSNHVFAGQDLGDRWHLRYDRDFREECNEFGLSYKVHNYLTLEYVYTDDGKWLRLIANL